MVIQVADKVWVHQSKLLQNNSTIVRGDNGVLLVDPGLTENELVEIADDIKQLSESVAVGFSTHPDWDHVLWHKLFGDKPRYATSTGASFMSDFLSKPEWIERAAEELPEEIANETPLDLFGKIIALPRGTSTIPWEGSNVRVIEHNAHAKGHAALFIKDSGVLIAGDMLSDLFVPMLNLQADDPINDYLHALNLFEELIGEINVVIPGHGTVAKDEEVRNRIELDKRYLDALRHATDFDDPRIGSSVPKAWEWVNGIHEWQVKQIKEKL